MREETRRERERVRKSAKKQFIAVTHTRQKLERDRESGGRGEVAKGIDAVDRVLRGACEMTGQQS